jgi:hypothetical protein
MEINQRTINELVVALRRLTDSIKEISNVMSPDYKPRHIAQLDALTTETLKHILKQKEVGISGSRKDHDS